MKRTILIAYAALVLFYDTLATDANVGKTPDEYVVNTKDIPPIIWFYSNLGYKRKDQQFDEQDCDEIESYIRTMPWSQINKCAIVEEKRDKSKLNLFSPRLGRDSNDVIGSIKEKWITNSLDNDNLISLRSQFVPRLGKRLPYTPRLGREV